MSIAVFWVMTPCGFVGGYQGFGRTYRLHLNLNPEDGGDKFLRNVGNNLQVHMASQDKYHNQHLHCRENL
jgi:hypothetical protein